MSGNRDDLWQAMMAVERYDADLTDPRIAEAFALLARVWAEQGMAEAPTFRG